MTVAASKRLPGMAIRLVPGNYWARQNRTAYFSRNLEMLSAMLFSVALVALFQFALYYWRAVLTGVASLPISSRILEAANVEEQQLSGEHFPKLAGLYALTPELKSNGGGLGVVRAYYHLAGKLGQVFARFAPSALSWSEREQLLCARYAAVQIGRRLETNMAQAAALRSS